MIYTYILPVIFSFSLLQLAKSSTDEPPVASPFRRLCLPIFSWVVAIVLLLNIYNYSIVSNQAYFQMHLVSERARTYSANLIDRIESVDGYSTELTVVFMGMPPDVPMENISEKLTYFMGLVISIPQTYRYDLYVNYYHGLPNPIKWSTYEESILTEPGIRNMSFYPTDGSVQLLGDCIYVCFEGGGQQ